MAAPMHSAALSHPLEERVRLASAVLFLTNASVACWLALGGSLRILGYDIGDLVTFPMAVAGIALALKLCGWPRSSALGYFLMFIYSFGVFAALIPYFGVHWYARMVWLRGLLHPMT